MPKILSTTAFRKSLALCLIVLWCSEFILPAQSFVVGRSACTIYPKCQRTTIDSSVGAERDTEEKIKEGTDEENAKDDEDPVEVFLAMEEASQRTTRRLMLPRMIMSSIGQTVTYGAYAFLIFCFGLNLFGYALINDSNGMRIGTLEERAFQIEVEKSMKDK